MASEDLLDVPEADLTTAGTDTLITVTGDLPLPGDEGDFDPAGTGYWGYGCVVSYSRDRGLRPQTLAAASRSALQTFNRTHTGKCIKVVTGVAIRLLSWPQIPDPTPQSNNDVLLFDELALFNPQIGPSGDPLFGVVWRYTYGMQQWPDTKDILDVGRSPMDLYSAGARMLTPGDFTPYLVSNIGSVSGLQPTVPVTW